MALRARAASARRGVGARGPQHSCRAARRRLANHAGRGHPRRRANAVLLGKPAHARYERRNPVVLHLARAHAGGRTSGLPAAYPTARGGMRRRHPARRRDHHRTRDERRIGFPWAGMGIAVAAHLRALPHRQFAADAALPAAGRGDMPLSRPCGQLCHHNPDLGLNVPAAAGTWLVLLVIAFVPGALSVVLFSYSVPRLGPGSYAIIANCELVTVVVIGVVALGEDLTASRVLGGALIASAILVHGFFGRPGHVARARFDKSAADTQIPRRQTVGWPLFALGGERKVRAPRRHGAG